MKPFGVSICVAVLCVFAVAPAAAQFSLPGQDGVPIEQLHVPLEYHPDGQVKTRLFADRAVVSPDPARPSSATGVRVEVSNEQGQTEVVVNLDALSYNRETLQAHSESPATVKGDGFSVAGTGFDWDGRAQTLRIRSKVRVELDAKRWRILSVRKETGE